MDQTSHCVDPSPAPVYTHSVPLVLHCASHLATLELYGGELKQQSEYRCSSCESAIAVTGCRLDSKHDTN